MDKRIDECMAERKLREWRVKSERMICDGLFIGTKEERATFNQQ